MRGISRLLVCAWLAGCASAQNAAARDPMRCERDPACAKSRGAYIDCDQQCADDPVCTSRCKQMAPDPGLSHH
jgi:hypothetical protein